MADLRDFTKTYLRSVERRVDVGADRLLTRLKDDCPIAAENGGTMRDSIEVEPRGLSVFVVVGVEYASFTREDTQPHEIKARRAQALRFFWDKVGPPQPRYFRRVQHPGTQGVFDWYGNVIEDWPRILESVA